MTSRQCRVGPKMLAAAAYVARYPGCAKLPAARYVAPTGVPGGRIGLQYGYRTVDRAIAAGLIRAERDPGRYRLYPT